MLSSFPHFTYYFKGPGDVKGDPPSSKQSRGRMFAISIPSVPTERAGTLLPVAFKGGSLVRARYASCAPLFIFTSIHAIAFQDTQPR